MKNILINLGASEMRSLFITVILLTSFSPVMAENKPTDHTNDKRIKTIVYRANDVMPIKASYKHITHIDLGPGNTIIDVAAGDTESWMFANTANNDGILLKPLTDDAKTNLTIITDKRTYYFDLVRSDWVNTYSVNFKYPEEEFAAFQAKLKKQKESNVNKDLGIETSKPDDWNFSYLLEGDKDSSPVNIFDDGKFTYLEFGKKEVPAIFAVDKEKNESVVNYHRSGRYVVVENIYRQLTLRNGELTTCIFNKEYDSQMFSPATIKKNEVVMESEESNNE